MMYDVFDFLITDYLMTFCVMIFRRGGGWRWMLSGRADPAPTSLRCFFLIISRLAQIDGGFTLLLSAEQGSLGST